MSASAIVADQKNPPDAMNRPDRDKDQEMKPESPIETSSVIIKDNINIKQGNIAAHLVNPRVVVNDNGGTKANNNNAETLGTHDLKEQIKSGVGSSNSNNNNTRQMSIGKMDGAIGPKDGSTRDKTATIKKTSTTTTLSRFKEKRPEPLKLNPNINQETPLDLSVKSAGNVPSGTLSSIFNNHHATLETPRIQWQDTDALLAAGKSRSSSMNASQKAPMSTLVGESPPVTPGSPLIHMILTGSKPSADPTHVPNDSSLDSSAHTLADSVSESKKAQILDRWCRASKLQSGQLVMKNDGRNGPRRSCSTDNLDMHNSIDQSGSDKFTRLRVRQDESGHMPKKTSISPLATNSLSNTQNESSSSTKFPYSNQHISTNSTDTQRSPTSNATGKPLTPTNIANATANLLNIHLNSPPAGGNSQSPVASSFGGPQYKNTSFSSFDHEPSPLDPLISAAFCQQQQQQHLHQHHTNQSGRSSINLSTSSLGTDINNNNYQHNILMQHHNISSISSSATLNTPTLISPSQLKAGQLCFLPSPTLSPMSSVFDLPSPFLMFPPSSTNHQSLSSGGSRQSSSSNSAIKMDISYDSDAKTTRKHDNANTHPHAHRTTDINDQDSPSTVNANRNCDTMRANSDNLLHKIPRNINSNHQSSFYGNGATSASDLSHLITPATGKTLLVTPKKEVIDTNDNDEEIDMDVEMDIIRSTEISQRNGLRETFPRPATVIPHICVSDDQSGGLSRSPGQSREGRVTSNSYDEIAHESSEHRSQRNSSSKRSLSPKSFRIQVKNYRTERLESCSAPPDIEQRRVRSKIKTIGADSSSNLVHKNDLARCESNKDSMARNKLDARPNCETIRSQFTINQQHRTVVKPYPEVRDILSSSSQHLLQTRATPDGGLGARSSSAEPTIYSRVLVNKVSSASSMNSTNNMAVGFYPSDRQLSHQDGTSLSQSAQQLNCTPRIAQNMGPLYQPIIAKQHQTDSSFQQNYQSLHQNNQNYHYPSQQQHQHSVSVGELNKIHSQANQRPPPSPMMMMMINGSRPSESQHYCGIQRQQLAQPTLLSHQQHFTQQSNSSSLTRVDSLTAANYQQTLADQRRQQQSVNVITDSATLMRNSNCTNNLQSSVKNLCNGDLCSQHLVTSQRSYVVNPMMSQQQHSMSNFMGVKLANSLNYSYQIDIESRSDSRSSSSLDFPSPYVGSGSRPDSAASSNLTSKKYHCDMCPKSFTRSDMLTRHRRLHSGDRPFQCGECKQEFSRSDHLSTHMRTHTGEKPYKCKLCSYSACRKDMITRHLKVHSRSPNATDFV